MKHTDRSEGAFLHFRYFLICAVITGLLFAAICVAFDLPQKIVCGEKGQMGIQVLDAMRHPFLAIKEAESRLISTGGVGAAVKNLADSTESASSLLETYLHMARYNPGLARQARELRQTYDTWITDERHLFEHLPNTDIHKSDTGLDDHVVCCINQASLGFLNTMNRLGEAEIPLLRDIDTGHRATRILMFMAGLLFLILVGMLTFQRKLRSRDLKKSYGQLTEEVDIRRQAEEALVASQRRLEAVREIGALATSSPDLEVVLQQILTGTIEAAKASAGMIFLKKPDDGRLYWGSSIGLSEAFVNEFKERSIQVGEGLTGQIAETDEPIYIPLDSSHDPRIARSVVKEEGLNSFIGVPVYAANEIVGVMNILTRPPDILGEQEIPLVAAIGSHVGSIIRNAQLFQEIKQAREDLLNSEIQYRTLFEDSSDAVFITTRTGKFIDINQAMLDLFGYSSEEMLSLDVKDICYSPGDRTRFKQEIEKQGSVRDYEMLTHRKDGRTLDCLVTATLRKDGAGNILGYQGVIRDITEQRKLERQIIRAKEEWEDAFDTINDAITIHDKDFNIIRANKAAEILLGLPLSKILRQKCYETYHGKDCPPAGCPSCLSLKSGAPSITEIFEPHLNKYVEVKALPQLDKNNQLVGLVHIVRDIDARKRAEEERERLESQLLQSQKMEAIGTLTGGIAHDFNNILTSIIGYSELTMLNLPEDHPEYDNLRIIHAAGEKAAALTKQLLAFSRKQVLEMKPVRLGGIINSITKILARVIGENITLAFYEKSEDNEILADQGQIEQVLMNLAVNARDAMPEGGRITIRTSGLVITHAANQSPGVAPGPYVVFSVQDNGEGMSEEIQKNIFEPFFTTKGLGKGTGLGLATVYGIVKQHNGHIQVQSEPGEGTTFTIMLPVYQGEKREVEKKEPVATLSGHETILVIEDEAPVRMVIVDILHPLGYNLIGAASAEEAFEISRAHKGAIDLLLTDVILPGLNGCEAAEQLTEWHPEMKVLFMSGYTDETISQHKVIDPDVNYINKPVTIDGLTSKLRDVLDGD